MTTILGHLSIDSLLKAQAFLSNAICNAHSELEKAGAIQAFEIAYELSWKTMKRILAFRGIETNSPRETFRLAATERLIDDIPVWFNVMEKRNLTVHVYNADVAKEVFDFLPVFAAELNKFIATIQALPA